MRFTLLGLGTATIMAIAGASIFFIPAFPLIGYAIDRNLRKD